jgi:hypothetical protein
MRCLVAYGVAARAAIATPPLQGCVPRSPSAPSGIRSLRCRAPRRAQHSRLAIHERGPVNAMDANALRRQKRPAQGAKAKAGRAPGEPLQRSAGCFWQQPGGNERLGPPLFVVLLAKTPGLRFVVRLIGGPIHSFAFVSMALTGPRQPP